MNSSKRTVLVTIEKELEIEFTPAVLNDMTEEQYLAVFRETLWDVESMDDVFEYAAEMAARYGSGFGHDGLGLVGEHYMTYPRAPDVKFRILNESIDKEITSPEQPS